MYIVQAMNLKKEYKDGSRTVRILDDVSLNVKNGEFLSIIGPSGSGKTTLLNVLSGLDASDGGAIVLNGLDITHLKEDDLARHRQATVGFIFQDFNLLDHITIMENILIPLLPTDTTQESLEKRANYLLGRVGLAEKKYRYPRQLSGGEKQRVAIVRALINFPKLIVADEPTGNLDSNTGQEIISLIKDLNEMENIAVVLVTHDNLIAQTAERKISMKDGKIIADETIRSHVVREHSESMLRAFWTQIRHNEGVLPPAGAVIPKESVPIDPMNIHRGKVSLVLPSGKAILVERHMILGREHFSGEVGTEQINRISRKHCEIFVDESGVSLRDGYNGTPSKNGTSLDGRTVGISEKTPLKNDSHFILGGVVELKVQLCLEPSEMKSLENGSTSIFTPVYRASLVFPSGIIIPVEKATVFGRDDFKSELDQQFLGRISRAHFEIGFDEKGMYISDGVSGKPSLNGVLVNDHRLMPGEKFRLSNGDKISVAKIIDLKLSIFE